MLLNPLLTLRRREMIGIHIHRLVQVLAVRQIGGRRMQNGRWSGAGGETLRHSVSFLEGFKPSDIIINIY